MTPQSTGCRTKNGLWVCGIVLAVCGSIVGQPAVPNPAATTAEQNVERILDTLERRGETVEDLTCELTLEIQDTRLFETTTKYGKLMFRRERPNALFRVDFHKLIEGDGTVKDKGRKEWHLFDGRWYTEAHELTKTVIRRELVREGETIDPFELGRGPFPLPFGQKKADILKEFTVELVPPAAADPSGSDHLKCVPRPGSPYADDYKALHFYISREQELPVRVVSHQKKERKTLTVNFNRIKTNTGLARSRLSEDFPRDWKRHIERLSPAPRKVGSK